MILNKESVQLISYADKALFEHLVEDAGFVILNRAQSNIDEIIFSIDEAITNLTPLTDMFKKRGRRPLTADQLRDLERRRKLSKERDVAQQQAASKETDDALQWPKYEGMRVHPESDEAMQLAYQDMIKKIAEDQGYIIKLLDELQYGIDNLAKQIS